MAPFLEWGRDVIRWALRERLELRAKRIVTEIDNADKVRELLEPFTTDQRKALMRIPVALSRTEMESPEILGVMKEVVNARDDHIVRQMWEDIDKEAPNVQAQIWRVVDRFGLIDARRNQTIIGNRLRAIDQLREYVDRGAREVPTIHNHIRDNIWLLDPRWDMLGDEVPLKSLGIQYGPKGASDTRGRMDFLFALQPSAPSTLDEILVVEIKRARMSDGKARKVNEEEINKFPSLPAHRLDKGTASTVTRPSSAGS